MTYYLIRDCGYDGMAVDEYETLDALQAYIDSRTAIEDFRVVEGIELKCELVNVTTKWVVYP